MELCHQNRPWVLWESVLWATLYRAAASFNVTGLVPLIAYRVTDDQALQIVSIRAVTLGHWGEERDDRRDADCVVFLSRLDLYKYSAQIDVENNENKYKLDFPDSPLGSP